MNPTHPLDNIHNLIEIDKSGMYKAIKDLPMQLTQAWDECMTIQIPDDYKDILNVVVAGMGGSSLGGHNVLSNFSERLRIPVEIVNNYTLPGYVGEKTVVILVSNSGNTEEVLSCGNIAKEKGCKIIVISTGGQLKDFADLNNYPKYIFDQRYNQTGQPRLSTGYVFMSILVFFRNLNVISFEDSEILDAIKDLNKNAVRNGLEISFEENPAKKLASKLFLKIPFIIGAEFLAGVIHTFNNQINENSKCLSTYFLIPELDHHLLEGLGYEQNKDRIVFLIIDSEDYQKRIRQRIEITRDIIEKNNFEVEYVLVKGINKIAQTFNLLQTGAYVSYYLALLNNIDPSPVPWVNFLKHELSDS